MIKNKICWKILVFKAPVTNGKDRATTSWASDKLMSLVLLSMIISRLWKNNADIMVWLFGFVKICERWNT